jgi:hypothetical protein
LYLDWCLQNFIRFIIHQLPYKRQTL